MHLFNGVHWMDHPSIHPSIQIKDISYLLLKFLRILSTSRFPSPPSFHILTLSSRYFLSLSFLSSFLPTFSSSCCLLAGSLIKSSWSWNATYHILILFSHKYDYLIKHGYDHTRCRVSVSSKKLTSFFEWFYNFQINFQHSPIILIYIWCGLSIISMTHIKQKYSIL